MRIAQSSIEQVREAADIVEVASEFTALRRQGNRFVGLCPYPDHSEKSPSFSVSAEQGFYYCFGCQKGGDAIKLITDLRSLSFTEAVSYLAERSNVELEFEGTQQDSEAAKKRHDQRREIHKSLAAAAVYYHKVLKASRIAENARKYLEGRKIESSTIEEFRLGYAPPRGSGGFARVAARLGLEREALEDAGLLSRGGDRFAGRITFPISDRRGRIVGFGARALGDEGPKYLNSPETGVFDKRNLLYGFPQVAEAVRRERSAVVVEGYTDVLMMYQSGIRNAVATLGTATTPAHLKTLSGYADKIHVLFDPDAAGERAVERAALTASELRLDLRVARLSEDPADWLLQHPAEEFDEVISASEPVFSYLFRRKAEAARGADAASRSRTLGEVQTLLAEIEDPVFLREARRIASEAFGVGPEALSAPPKPSGGGRRSGGTRVRDPLTQAGRDVLSLILSRPDLTAPLIESGVDAPALAEPLVLMPGDFARDEQAALFALLVRHAGRDLDSLLADVEARRFMDVIGQLAAEGERLYPTETSVREAWLRLGVLSRQLRMRREPDYDAKERLRQEVQTLRAALQTVAPKP